jgi:hypothetical protein
MSTILSAFVSLLSFRFRSRAGLELDLVALRHQVAVLRRHRKGRLRLFVTDRLLWVWLYRIWPQTLNAMVLVKPATIIQLCFSMGPRRRSAPQVSDLIDTEGVTRARLFTPYAVTAVGLYRSTEGRAFRATGMSN